MVAAVLLAAIGASERASACTLLNFETRIVSRLVPVDGRVVIRVACFLPPCPTEIDVRVSQFITPIPGTVESIVEEEDERLFLIWKPDEALAPGTYTVLADVHSRPSLREDFEVFDDSTSADLPTIQLEPRSTIDPVGEVACCPLTAGCGQPCFFRREVVRPTVFAQWSSPGPVLSGQRLYRLRKFEESGESTTPWDAGAQRGSASERFGEAVFDVPAAEYCVALEAMNVVDSTVERGETVCLDGRTGFAELGERDHTLEGLDKRSCEAPPEGYVEEWCAANAPGCEGDEGPSCERVRETCAASLTAVDDISEADDDVSVGCHVATARSAPATMAAALAFAVVAMGRRRRIVKAVLSAAR